MTPAYPKPEKRGPSVGERSAAAVNARREDLYLRDDYQCVVEGTPATFGEPCADPNTIQHRKGKDAGGSALFDSYAHLITLCWNHNILAERDADFAAECRANGWSLPRKRVGLDAALAPVRYHSGFYLLDHETFDCTWITPPEFAERMRELDLF
jgi:hypothetical protein